MNVKLKFESKQNQKTQKIAVSDSKIQNNQIQEQETMEPDYCNNLIRRTNVCHGIESDGVGAGTQVVPEVVTRLWPGLENRSTYPEPENNEPRPITMKVVEKGSQHIWRLGLSITTVVHGAGTSSSANP